MAVVCALSLAVNLGLVGYMALKPHDAVSSGIAKTVESQSSANGGLSLEARQLLATGGVDNLELLRDRLRVEGLPESIVRDVVGQRLWSVRQAKLDAADPLKKRPWWQQTQEQLPGDDVRMARLTESSRSAVLARLDELFPDSKEEDVDPAMAFLPVAKQRALQKLQRDYAELHRRLDAETGSYLSSSDLVKQQYLRDEEDKDIRALLTPEEDAERKLRNPAEFRDEKKRAAMFDLSESQFRGWLALQQWVAREYEKIGAPNADPFAPRSPEQEAAASQIRQEELRQRLELIGAEQHSYYEAVEFDIGEYEAVARYVARHDLPPAKVKEYYDFISRWERAPETQAINQNAALSIQERRQAFTAVMLKMEAPLIELMGPAIMESELGLVQWLRSVKPQE